MEEFLKKMAAVLEENAVQEIDVLKSFAQWDSLSVLSTIAMIDNSYGVSLHASEVQAAATAGDLWRVVETKKRA
jgi:acyl carrier protein